MLNKNNSQGPPTGQPTVAIMGMLNRQPLQLFMQGRGWPCRVPSPQRTLPLLSIRFVHEFNTPQAQAQRTRRPMSPHISIYQPQLTWLMSIGHRMTGVFLTGLVYSFGTYYAIAEPGLVTESLARTVEAAPTALVALGKLALAWPFFYHTLNGIRHLTWDLGYALSLRGCYISGWLVNAGSILLTAITAFL